MNVSSRYGSSIDENECVFCVNEQQKLYFRGVKENKKEERPTTVAKIVGTTVWLTTLLSRSSRFQGTSATRSTANPSGSLGRRSGETGRTRSSTRWRRPSGRWPMTGSTTTSPGRTPSPARTWSSAGRITAGASTIPTSCWRSASAWYVWLLMYCVPRQEGRGRVGVEVVVKVVLEVGVWSAWWRSVSVVRLAAYVLCTKPRGVGQGVEVRVGVGQDLSLWRSRDILCAGLCEVGSLIRSTSH